MQVRERRLSVLPIMRKASLVTGTFEVKDNDKLIGFQTKAANLME